ncbi:MAG: hypothetical protein K2X82_33625 [Gemmataceae bacterium]|nr:hypothetical protein [Gemmataceae bacterium]
MYPPGVEPALRARLRAAGIDIDAVNVIVRAGGRADVPPLLGDVWAVGWDGPPLAALAAESQADRQHRLAREVDAFPQDPLNRLTRARHAATQTADADLWLAGELAVDLADLLAAFQRDVLEPITSPFTGKLLYRRDTDIDVATAAVVIEVSTRTGASRKVTQLAKLLGPLANPAGLPVLHYMPNLVPGGGPARALLAAGSAGVYTDRAAVAAVVRALP